MTTDELIAAFEHLESWEERFHLISELERELRPISGEERIEANQVPGCTTRTWLSAQLAPGDPQRLEYHADAEGPLVRGLVAVLLMPFQGKTPEEVLATDPRPFIDALGLETALSPHRRAGMEAFLARVRALASEAQSVRP
jgi:cysteine desulfuration protein SufE